MADVTAADISWQFSSASPWPDTAGAVNAAREALAFIDDDLAVDVIEQLLIAAADRSEEVRAIRATLSVTLGLLHDEQREVVRVKRRNIDLLDRQRAAAVTS